MFFVLLDLLRSKTRNPKFVTFCEVVRIQKILEKLNIAKVAKKVFYHKSFTEFSYDKSRRGSRIFSRGGGGVRIFNEDF